MQALVDRHRQFVDNTLSNGKPVKFTQDGRGVIKLLGLRERPWMSIFIPGHPYLCFTTCSGPTGATGSTGIKGVRGRIGATGATGATGLQVHRINRRAVIQTQCPGKTMSNDSIKVFVAIKDKV